MLVMFCCIAKYSTSLFLSDTSMTYIINIGPTVAVTACGLWCDCFSFLNFNANIVP